MKSDTFHMSMLYDYYGELLTEKQKELFDLYYNEDLSLAEIAEHAGISRQGVRDAIVRSETILHFLAQRQVYVSSGSACSKGQKSPVLGALGLSDAEIDSAIRVSLSRYTDESDIDALLEGLCAAAATLKRR